MTQQTGPRGRSRPRDDRLARERLVEAARVAFGTNGFHATTTRDIAAAAGMSPAAVYVHHPSKEALLFALSDQGHRSTLEALRAAVAQEPTPTAQLSALVHAFVLREAVEHTTARIVNYELDALAPEHREHIDDLRRQIQQVTLDVVRQGIADGEFDCDDAELTATAIMALGIDVSRWFRDERSWTPDRVAEHHAAAALRMVGARTGGRRPR